jgi:hypothetical protein
VSTRDHELIEGLLAVHALDGLDGDDLATLEAEREGHGDCARCAEIEADFRELAGRMALSLDPQPVDMAIADRILSAGSNAPVVPPPPDTHDIAAKEARRKRTGAAILAVAATFVLVVGAAGVYLNGARTTSVASASPTQRVVTFERATPGGNASLAMAYTPGKSGVAFWGSHLPDPGPGMTYEIWMITGDTPVSGGCLRPTDGSIAAWVDADVGTADLMAVTAEPSNCPSTPTGTPLLTAPLA